MMDTFELALSECIEALRDGRWDLDACLRRYPQHAQRLRPQLETVWSLSQAYGNVTPDDTFAEQARERFLIATGQRLREAMDVEPELTFFAAARVRFLMTAHKMGLRERARRPRLPFVAAHFRALATGMAALALLLGAGAYTVATADAALPGDWQYPVKLQTERVRLALAFSESAKRDVRLDIAEERAVEIEKLAQKGRVIGPGEIGRMVDQTQPLVEAAQKGELDAAAAERLQRLAERQKQLLEYVAVDPSAEGRRAQAVQLSQQAIEAAVKRQNEDPARPPKVVTASVELTPTPSPSPTATPQPPDATPPPPVDTPAVEAPAPASRTPVNGVVVSDQPVVTRDSVDFYELLADHVRVLIPAPHHGWFLLSEAGAGAPTLVRISNDPAILGAHGSSLIVVSALTGDAYWYVNVNGRVDEVQLRATRDGKVFIADKDLLRATYGDFARVPLMVLDSIEVSLPPAPTPTSSPAPAPTATP